MLVGGDQGLRGGRMLSHRCLGSHLARIEITVVLRERLHKIPDFATAYGAVIKKSSKGIVHGPRTPPLMF